MRQRISKLQGAIMALGSINVGSYKNVSATANICPRPGALLGFYVNSTSSGTIRFYDSATTTTAKVITNVITPAVGWHPLPVAFTDGLYAVIASTLDVTVVFA
jgi:hypothetical protein